MSFKMEVEPETISGPGPEDWLSGTDMNNHYAAARVTLPSRGSKYRNLSAGANKKPRARPTPVPIDRPPSRQSHAFPTHLIDANAFSGPDIENTGKNASLTSSASSARSGRRCTEPSASLDGIIPDRPPSRYMVKAKRNSKQSPTPDHNAPSRRDVVEKNIVFSSNQTHHDPKTDGFAEVDESVPPPFRIEVTTDTIEPALDSPEKPCSLPVATKTPRSARRWPSISNQEQLLRMVVADSDGNRGNDHGISSDLSQLQWFGKDDQIDNAHLFETVITLPSPRAVPTPDADIAIEDDLEDSEGPQTHSREVVNKQNQPEYDHVETHFPSRRAAVASKMKAKTTTLSMTDNQEQHWIRSSTNPFFVDSPSTLDYDSMDPDTAIEQTPLYSSEDLMTLSATEMTDLRLDDYTALGDASMPAPPPTSSGMEWGSRLLQEPQPSPLRTSLGKDFLSLFAQH
ncbi:hypothetical protein PHMEG_0006529 [Phytophthora megakarya]|uniref:Uncharacterized protein n=1 Tax=Phytophthora megakarya TaxID=4795 RepID=A0A225WNK4_9STRA|nr:hypothetical protein PHMEG_0006529 [Phytophthora megakarya]